MADDNTRNGSKNRNRRGRPSMIDVEPLGTPADALGHDAEMAETTAADVDAETPQAPEGAEPLPAVPAPELELAGTAASEPARGPTPIPETVPTDPAAVETLPIPADAAEPPGTETTAPVVRDVPPVESQPPPPPRSGMGAGLLGGIAGAALVALIAGVALASGWVGAPPPARDDTAALRTVNDRIAALEGERPRLAGVEQAVQRLEPRVAARESAPVPPAASDGAPLDAVRGDVARLGEQVTALESRLSSLPDTAAAADDGPAQRVAADVGRLGDALGGIDRRMGEVDGRLAALDGRIAAADGRIGAIDLAPLRGELQALRAELAQLRAAPPSALERSAALVIAATQLEAALRGGGPFATELAAVKALGPGNVDLAALERRAATGVPGARALAERFRAVSGQVVSAARPAPEGAVDRVMQSFGGIVSVRPTGAPLGDDAAATVARIEERLNRGELGPALDDFNRLPAPAQAAAGGFGADLGARVAAERLLEGVKTDILRGAARG